MVLKKRLEARGIGDPSSSSFLSGNWIRRIGGVLSEAVDSTGSIYRTHSVALQEQLMQGSLGMTDERFRELAVMICKKSA